MFQDDLTGTNVNANSPGALGLPLWFIERMAEYFSIGPVDSLYMAMWMRDAARREKLPDIDHPHNPEKYFPYRYGQALWAYIGGRYGTEVIPDLLHAAGTGRNSDYRAAFKQVLGVDTKTLSILARPPSSTRIPVPSQKSRECQSTWRGRSSRTSRTAESSNVSPEAQPLDGSKPTFFSERDSLLDRIASG